MFSPIPTDRSSKPLSTWLCAAVILLLNVIVTKRLFFLGFSMRMDSIESAYMSISRFVMRHWGDLTWFPLWYTGVPFRIVYQPLLHVTVAALATVAHEPVQVAYHSVTALVYCLGPLALFALCFDATQSRAFAFVTALLYSLFSPVSFLIPEIRVDAGGYLSPRRLQALVQYGEGPHTTALAILPLAILLLHRAITSERRHRAVLAAVALAAVVMTSWPGSVGLTMAVIAYLLSRIGQRPGIRWVTLAGVCLGGYLLISPWLPPSMVLFVQTNAQRSDPPDAASVRLLALAAAGVVCSILYAVLRRTRANPWFGFFLYFLVLSGTVVLGRYGFGIRVLPQPNRFELEMGMALCGVIAYLAVAGFKRMPNKAARAIAIAGFVLLCFVELRTDVAYEKAQIRNIDPTGTIEYRMGKAFERLTGTERVFAPGNVSYWLNVFTDVPQVAGCCENGIPTVEHRIATFVIFTGLNAGDRDAAISTLWLQAYGAHAVGVTGKHSTEPYKPFVNPEKFNGVLRELWRDGDDVIYEVPQRSPGLAHVVNPADVIGRPPVNGLDTGPLEPYVRAINNPDYPQAEFAWLNQHQARVKATFEANQLLSVQISHFPGWHARVNGAERPLTADALGMMVIEPRCSGACAVDLSFETTPELRWMRVIQIAVVLIGIVLLVRSRRDSRPH
jgi:hypothetical protein